MAIPNVNAPNGLKSHGRNSVGGWVTRKILQKAAADAQAIFAGDAVTRVSGYVTTVGLVPGTTPYYGVSENYAPALTASDHLVITDNEAEYIIQDDGAAAGIDFGRIGKNANIGLGAGNPVTHQSGHVLAEASIAVAAALDLHILDLLGIPTNSFGLYARVVVKFNAHRLSTATVGA